MAEDTLINCGYWKYLGESDVPKASGSIKEIDPAQLDYGHEPIAEYTQSHSTPRILTRAEKGQALTHLEMDFNLASLFHKLNTSSADSHFLPEENSGSEDADIDVYFERHKPTRAEEMEGMFATFSYAPVCNGTQSIIQNAFQTIKIQHTTDEIRYKLSNELIPGTLDIEEDFHVTGSAFVKENLAVSGNAKIALDTETNTLCVNSSSVLKGEVRVEDTASFDGDVYIKGNLYVNGVMFGNLSQPAYNSLTNPGYAQPYTRFGTQDTGSHVPDAGVQSDARLKTDLSPLLSETFEILDRVEPYRFTWKPEAEKSGKDVGVLAQDVKALFPEAVTEGSDGYLRVDYEKFVPVLIGAFKELKREVDELQEIVACLRSRVY